MVTKYIDVKVDLDEFATDEICDELLQRENWRKALQTSINKSKGIVDDEDDPLREIIEAHKRGQNLTPILPKIAYNELGIIL
jgi:hypothetical protein